MKKRISTVGNSSCRESGFTYLILLIAMVVIGVMAEVAVAFTSTSMKIEREAELIFRGQAYQRAISSYYHALPKTKSYPRSLDDLLLDPRFPMKRHIRKLYDDPITGTPDWRVIRTVEGGVAGVASRSMDVPLKVSGFPIELESFEAVKTYSKWVFEFKPKAKKYSR